ncbi:MAG: branched-chain amino acid ABC transporter permease [Rhodobacter sp.]|nr:branched-chain amino acid ABC transporter permease [Paracoccaceae bacterium]MCC0076254.1 branched-chain amino acid ABC transporter permease [Rhodobacter sp.]
MLDTLLSGQLLFAAAVLGALYALIGLGLNLVYGTMRLLNIAHGDFLMLGAYGAFWWFTLTGISPLIALPLIAAGGAGIGLALYALVFRKQLATGLAPAVIEARSLLLFFGVSVVIQNVTALLFSATPRAYRHLDTVYQIGQTAMTGNRIASLLVALAILGGVLVFLNRTLFGLEIKALIQHREAARIVGINVSRVQIVAIALGFGSAAIAGGLLSMTEQVTPFMGFRFTIAAFVVIIMGGLGNILGGIVAGFLLAVIEIYAVTLFSAEARSILIYGAFVAILLISPQGLLGRARR